jgi:hypothetical protein
MTMTGMMPVTYAVTLMEFPRESCGLLQSVAWMRSISATKLTSALTDAAETCTKRLFVRAQLFQARLQDLCRVLGSALALDISETASDGG